MPDTSVQQLISGVYALLRRVSKRKLPTVDVLARLNDVVRAYLQEQSISANEQGTDTAAATVVANGNGIDFLLTVTNVREFEPVHLVYALTAAPTAFFPIVESSFEEFERHRTRTDYIAGVFYDQALLADGVKLRLNIAPANIGNYIWRLAYRLPLLTALAKGTRIPVPVNFLSMVKVATALLCIPMVRDDTKDWAEWVATARPSLESELRGWESRHNVRLLRDTSSSKLVQQEAK